MGQDYKIKLGSVLSLDSVKEGDLIEQLEDLRGRHKLGEFIMLCIRACYERPSIMKEMREKLGCTGIHKDREAFFNEMNNQIKEMQDKVNAIYEMAFTMYTMTQCGKRIGLEEKSDNTVLSSFLLKRQIDKLANNLGLNSTNINWVGTDREVTRDKVDRVLELLIESYSGDILNEVVQETKRTVVIETTEQIQAQPKVVQESQVQSAPVVNERVKQAEIQSPIISEKEFESNANWGALNSFLNI